MCQVVCVCYLSRRGFLSHGGALHYSAGDIDVFLFSVCDGSSALHNTNVCHKLVL